MFCTLNFIAVGLDKHALHRFAGSDAIHLKLLLDTQECWRQTGPSEARLKRNYLLYQSHWTWLVLIT